MCPKKERSGKRKKRESSSRSLYVFEEHSAGYAVARTLMPDRVLGQVTEMALGAWQARAKHSIENLHKKHDKIIKFVAFLGTKKFASRPEEQSHVIWDLFILPRRSHSYRCVADVYFLLFRFLHISKSTLHPLWNRKKLSYINSTSIQRLERSDDMTSWWCWWWKEKGTREWKDKNQIFFSSSSYLRRLLFSSSHYPPLSSWRWLERRSTWKS